MSAVPADEAAARDPDGPPLDDLAPAFVLPPHLAANERLAALHATIVGRLRREAAGMPMNTIQNLLLERIAYNYVALKAREDAGVAMRPQDQKEMNTFWLAMTKEFNGLLAANQDKMREALLLEVQKVVNGSLSLVTDPVDRQAVRRHLSEQFATINL